MWALMSLFYSSWVEEWWEHFREGMLQNFTIELLFATEIVEVSSVRLETGWE